MNDVGVDRGRIVASLGGIVVVAWALYLGVGWTYVSTTEAWSDGHWMGPAIITLGVLGAVGIVLVVIGVALLIWAR